MQMFIVTIQSHALSAGVRPHHVTANEIRDGLVPEVSGTYVSGHSGVTPVIPANSTPEQVAATTTKRAVVRGRGVPFFSGQLVS